MYTTTKNQDNESSLKPDEEWIFFQNITGIVSLLSTGIN